MRSTRPIRRANENDIGTLWTMRRFHHVARCALIECDGDWELRVLIEDAVILSRSCRRGNDAFALGELWKQRMLRDGWQLRDRIVQQHA